MIVLRAQFTHANCPNERPDAKEERRILDYSRLSSDGTTAKLRTAIIRATFGK